MTDELEQMGYVQVNGEWVHIQTLTHEQLLVAYEKATYKTLIKKMLEFKQG